jgi:hypothetical protein
MELQDEYINDLNFMHEKEASIFSHLYSLTNYDIYQTESIPALLRDMVNAGMKIKEEPFVEGIRNTLKVRGYLTLRK